MDHQAKPQNTSKLYIKHTRVNVSSYVKCFVHNSSSASKSNPDIRIFPIFTAKTCYNSNSEKQEVPQRDKNHMIKYLPKTKIAYYIPTASNPANLGMNCLIWSSAAFSAFSVSHSKETNTSFFPCFSSTIQTTSFSQLHRECLI